MKALDNKSDSSIGENKKTTTSPPPSPLVFGEDLQFWTEKVNSLFTFYSLPYFVSMKQLWSNTWTLHLKVCSE